MVSPAAFSPEPRIRMHEFEPVSGPAPTRVVIVPSGKIGPIDQGGFEAELYERLTGRLLSLGLSVIRFDAEESRPHSAISTATRREVRSDRLMRVMANQTASENMAPFIFIGVSLGALSVLDLLKFQSTKKITSAILIGCVVEEPTVIMQPLDRIDFVFGSRDIISYCNSSGEVGEIIRPETYGPDSAGNLVVLPRVIVSTHILEGVGHTLARPSAHAPDDDTLDLLARLVTRCLDTTVCDAT